MKAKSKVLLGLLVALAMMVMAVPAFAQSSVDFTLTPTKDEGLVVYTGTTGKITVSIKGGSQGTSGDAYEVSAVDTYRNETDGGNMTIATITLNGQNPEGDLEIPATAGTVDVAKHPINITVKKTKGEGQGGYTTVENYVVDVKQNIAASLSTENLTAVKSAETVAKKDIFKMDLVAGETAEVNVTRKAGAGEGYTYQWQIADAGADVTAAQYLTDNPTFKDIAGETNSRLQKQVDIDDNGKYVRCIVTDKDGNKVVASAVTEEGTVDPPVADKYGYCVRLDVTDKNLVCAEPTEDQDVSIIMTQTKPLTVKAKAGTAPYTYKWMKNGVEVTADDPFVAAGEPVNGPTLTLKGDADKSAEGDYVCEIEDTKHVRVTSPVFHVTVAEMPKLTLDPSVVSAKAEYNKTTGLPINGNGDTFVATADKDKPLTLTANIENPADVKSVKWETMTYDENQLPVWKSETQGPSTTFEVANPSAVEAVRATVEFKDIPCTTGTIDKALVYTTTINVTDGKLSGGVYTYIGNDATKEKADNSPTYTIELPSGVFWKSSEVAKLAKGRALTGDDTAQFVINLPEAGDGKDIDKALTAVVEVAPETDKGLTKMSFVIQPVTGQTYPLTVNKPYVKNMSVIIPAGLLSDKQDGTGTHTGNVVLPVSDAVGYKIMRKAETTDLTLKKKQTPYNTKEQPAEVIGKDDAKIGEVSEVRYMPKATALAGVTDKGTNVPFITADPNDDTKVVVNTAGFATHPAAEKAFYAALSSEKPVDVDDYIVVCNVAASDELDKADNLLVPDVYKIDAATKDTVEKDPSTFFTWTKEKVYNGDEQFADVEIADGMTKAGMIDEVTYQYVDEGGRLVTTTPNAVGTYRIFVTTKADPEEVDTNKNVGVIAPAPGAYIGDFRITKLPLSKDLFKMDPTEADYTGNPIVPEITTETAGVGKIAAVHYYAEGSEKELGSAPVAAGVYTVKIDVEEGENYEATKEPLEVGTLTINDPAVVKPTYQFATHLQDIGWSKENKSVAPGTSKTIGTTGQCKRLEAFALMVPENYTVEGFAHIENFGDTQPTRLTTSPNYQIPEGFVAYEFGTQGKALRIEAVNIGIKDPSGKLVDGFNYEVHVENLGWLGAVRNGSFTGTRHQCLRVEAIKFDYAGTPAETKPAEETPAEEKPAEETPAEETPTNPAE